MKQAVFTVEARDELNAAAEWYDAHAPGLGQQFFDCIAQAIARVGENPVMFPPWEGDAAFRRAVVARFPYVIFFRDLADAVEIVAIAHGAREPGYWVRRK